MEDISAALAKLRASSHEGVDHYAVAALDLLPAVLTQANLIGLMDTASLKDVMVDRRGGGVVTAIALTGERDFFRIRRNGPDFIASDELESRESSIKGLSEVGVALEAEFKALKWE
ncbi:MAG: hypothetical protein PHS44_06315 [Candidatus Dojkabacteria bacterium]|jgi:hypothetical protein|nr:hypothetical protein [Candidatus Dojkabacteria bacterium]